MAANVTPAGQQQYQKLKEACDTFLREVEQTLSFQEYPKMVDGIKVSNAEEEAKLKGDKLPEGEEADPRTANTKKK